MMLLKLGIFDITFGTVFTFVFGIAIGIAIVTILYLIFVLQRMKSKKFEELASIKIEEYELSPNIKKKEKEAILEKKRLNDNAYLSYKMIVEYQEIFKDKKLRNGLNDYQYTEMLAKSLVENIATLYYPKSKHPVLEISIEEMLDLSKYLSKRVAEMLDYNGLRFIRRFKINSIVGISDLSHSINESKIMQATRKYHINKIVFGFKILLNIVNPIYWVRKAIVNTSFSIVSKKLCLNVLQVIGEETYNIYSKSVFKEADLIEE